MPAGDPGSALHARGPHGIPDKAVLSATRERWDSAREGGSPKAIPLPAAQPSPPAPNPALGETSGSGSRRRLLRGHRRKGPRASLPPHPWGTAQRRRRGSRIHPRCAAQLTRNPSPPSAAPRPRVRPSPGLSELELPAAGKARPAPAKDAEPSAGAHPGTPPAQALMDLPTAGERLEHCTKARPRPNRRHKQPPSKPTVSSAAERRGGEGGARRVLLS